MTTALSHDLPPPSANILLQRAADTYRANAEWRRTYGLSHPHTQSEHRHAEALHRARADEVFRQIRHELEPKHEARARLILERSPSIQKEPWAAIMLARGLYALAPEREHVGLGSIPLRSLVEEIGRAHPGLIQLLTIWLHETDRKIYAAILEHASKDNGEAELRAWFDEHAHEKGVPTGEWWSYPARTAREFRERSAEVSTGPT